MKFSDAERLSGRVAWIELENFKSYRGNSVIGPFKSFTTVIGPNGSGKSNLMDAISFVLGVKTAHLRGNLKELLYHNSAGENELDQPHQGYVKLVFEGPDGEHVHLMRLIAPKGTSAETYSSQYKINDQIVTVDAYIKKLESYNILVKARNFLVFQGDIADIAQKSPKELTVLLEHISGSEHFRKAYEDLEAKKAGAEDLVSKIFSKKKLISQEKKLKKEQKDEAEKHARLQKELDETKKNHYLWQVYHIEQDICKARIELHKQQSDLEEYKKRCLIDEGYLNEKKRALAGNGKERLLLEKKIKRMQADMEKKNPNIVRVKEGINRCHARIAAGKKVLDALTSEKKQQQQKMNKMEEQLLHLRDAQQSLQEKINEKLKGRMDFSEEQHNEYNRIKQEVGAHTSKIEAERKLLQERVKVDEEALGVVQNSLRAINDQIKQLEEQRASSREMHDTLEMKCTEDEMVLREMNAQQERFDSDRRQVDHLREKLRSELEKIEGKLREAKADRKEDERDQKKAAVVEELKRQVPGVYGRVSQLCSVLDPQNNIAVSVAMGKHFDSIIVDTGKTATACISYLKANRLAELTFLPLDQLKVKSIDYRMQHSLHGQAKLAIELVEYDPHLQKAFQFVFQNTLVCEEVSIARSLAFDGIERHRVVASTGLLFEKSGLMTGGKNTSLEGKAARLLDKSIEGLKKERSRYQDELDKLPSLREAVQEKQSILDNISSLEHRLTLQRAELKTAKERMSRCSRHIDALKKELEAKLPEAKKMQEKLTEQQKQVERVTKRLNEIVDRIFKNFSKKVGVKNIREYEETHLRQHQEALEEKKKLSTQISRIMNQLDYENKNNKQVALEHKNATIQEARKELSMLEKEEQQLTLASASVQGELKILSTQLTEMHRKHASLAAEINELKSLASQHRIQMAKYESAIRDTEGNMHQLQLVFTTTTEKAVMDSVQLPQLVADLVEDPDEMDEDVAAQSLVQTSDHEKVFFDFSSLSREQTNTESKWDRERMDADFVQNIEEIQEQLSRLAPNMKAVEQFKAIQLREREQVEELEKARIEAKSATEAFNLVRQKRYDLFQAAFDHISKKIDTIYKELTRSSVHSLGGQAYMSAENNDEPFLGGINYNAMPPGKRYREMEQLSGGEKTVAALALLFAIHSFQPSPFFVLDEIDAALDATNVIRVANYMRYMTREDTSENFQGIVISLKDTFFEKADALIGVCKDNRNGCSATFTFDLTQFD